jgi:hypothetical protein
MPNNISVSGMCRAVESTAKAVGKAVKSSTIMKMSQT